MLNFKQYIENLFKNNDKFSDSNNKLYTNTILEAIENIDSQLIKILINDKIAKKHFFTSVEDVYVLNQIKLIEFFTINNHFEDSYTSYSNKIGLIKKDNFIKKFDDVVLAFPHKDCILEGGQTKDDDKSKENFFNEIINSDDIDRLEEPKVLTNIKKYSKDGVEKNPTIKDDDNLIIKGNNLLALYSLRAKYNGKVKLIYIDPPYNTGNDSFKYNDNFNHSTWLTFMKNRLEVAKEFLSDDGVIFVQCDDNEQAYLKILMDEIFGKDNFINNIIPVMNPRGRQESSYPIAKSHEYILTYSKNTNMASLYNINKVKKGTDSSYRLLGLRKSGNASKREDRPNMFYPIYYNELNNDITVYKKEGYNISILPIKTNDNSEGRWRWKKENVEANKHLLIVKHNSKNNYDIYEKNYTIIDGEAKGNKLQTFIKNVDIINDKAKEHLKNLFNIDIFDYPKSEYLLKILIEFATKENDLVMDFHLGSGTTCAVAHKMNRRYIGIEQMDYIEDISVQRLKKAINGEQGGISKAVNWQGGGSFVYAELTKIDNFKNKDIEALNKNMQYLPIGDIEDEDYNISNEEIAINKNFYGIDI